MEENKELVITEDLFKKLDDSEKNSEFIAMESKTFFKDAYIDEKDAESWKDYKGY